MFKRRMLAVLLLGLGAFQAMTAPSPLTLEQRVMKLENQVAFVSDLNQEIADMKDQILQLNGQVERLTHDLEVEKTRHEQLQSTISERQQEAKTNFENPPTVLTAELGVDTPKKKSSAKGKKESSDQASYEAAYQFVTQNDYANAIKAFEQFLKQYSDSRFVSGSHYWLGELYVMQGQADEAIPEFEWVVKNASKSLYAPEATFKLGMIYKTQGDQAKAQKMFKKVMEEYPKTKAATNASQKLRTAS